MTHYPALLRNLNWVRWSGRVLSNNRSDRRPDLRNEFGDNAWLAAQKDRVPSQAWRTTERFHSCDCLGRAEHKPSRCSRAINLLVSFIKVLDVRAELVTARMNKTVHRLGQFALAPSCSPPSSSTGETAGHRPLSPIR